MVYNLVSKLNKMLIGRKVEYRKDKLYVNGIITYIVDVESYEYGKIYIDSDGYNTYSFCMHNADGQRNVRCHYLKETEVLELFSRAINKDLELYNY
jgi:hypothetical protein